MKQTVVGQVALNTLNNYPGAVVASVHGTLPGIAKRHHDVTRGAVPGLIADGYHIAGSYKNSQAGENQQPAAEQPDGCPLFFS